MKTIDAEMVTGMELKKTDCERFEPPCDVCVRAKRTRFPFNTEKTRATRYMWSNRFRYF